MYGHPALVAQHAAALKPIREQAAKPARATIAASVIDGVTYYTTTRRGVEYTAYTTRGTWQVITRRLALGRFNPGGCKHFDDIKTLCEMVKAFSGLDLLI